MNWNCSTCHYSRLRGPDHLECRRHHPVATLESYGLPNRGEHPQACWPRVEPTDWCGDHRPQDHFYRTHETNRFVLAPNPYDDPLA